MKKLILSLILSFSLCIVSSVMSNNAEYPPNPHDCCVFCPYYEQELCFWNDSNFLYMSVDPDSVGYCYYTLVVIQDGYQYDNHIYDEHNNFVSGDMYVYVEGRIAEYSFVSSSPFDPTRSMTLVIKDYTDYRDDIFLEYPLECGVVTTTIPITTTSVATTTSTIVSTTTTTINSTCLSEVLYGENSEEVKILRFLRDVILSQTQEGQELIRLYYQWSPIIIIIMEEDGEFKEEVKEMIDKILYNL